MAYINLAGGLKINTADAVDSRLVLTKAEMKSLHYADDESRPTTLRGKIFQLPSNYLCVCSEDNKIYVYNALNEEDEFTGRFRKVESDPVTIPVTDVRVNGVSVVSDTVANIDTTNLMPKVLEVSIDMDTTQLQQSINSFNPIEYTADNVSTVRDFILAQEGTIKLTINTPVGTARMDLRPSLWKFEGDVYSYNFEGSDTFPFDLTSIGGTAFNQIIVSLIYEADTVNLISTILPVEASNVLEIPITKIITSESKIATLVGAMSSSNSVLTAVEFDTPIQYSELDGKDYIKLDLSSLGVNGYYMFYNQTTLDSLGRSYNLTIYSLDLTGAIIRNLAMIGFNSALTYFIIDVNVKNSYYCTETEVDNKINAAIGNVLNGEF